MQNLSIFNNSILVFNNFYLFFRHNVRDKKLNPIWFYNNDINDFFYKIGKKIKFYELGLLNIISEWAQGLLMNLVGYLKTCFKQIEMKHSCKFDAIIRIWIVSIMNSWGTLFSINKYFHVNIKLFPVIVLHKISNAHDNKKCTPGIVLVYANF